MPRLQRVGAVIFVLVSLAGLCLAQANWRHPVLRLASPYANVLALWVLLMLPWAAATVALIHLRRWALWLMLALVVSGIVYTGVDIIFVSLGLFTTPIGEPNPAFQPLRRLPLPRGGSLVVYLDDCGAPCPYIVVVRQERVLVLGLLLVRDVYVKNGIADASVEILTPDRARVDGQEVRLRPWVYW